MEYGYDVVCGIYLFLLAWKDAITQNISLKWIMIGSGLLLMFFFLIEPRLIDVILGASVGILFLGISRWTKEAIGYGDSLLMTLLGAYLGIWGILNTMLIASILCGIVVLIGFATKQIKNSSRIPFLPFVFVGFVGNILWM